MIDLEYKICSSMIFCILFLKHTICHRFRIQKDIFHILLPKQTSSLGTGSGPVPTSPPSLFGTRFWQETNRKIAPEELCRGKFPHNRARFGGSPRTNSILLYSRSRRFRRWANWATTRPAVPTLPSRAHLQDYGRRTTPSNYTNMHHFTPARFG